MMPFSKDDVAFVEFAIIGVLVFLSYLCYKAQAIHALLEKDE